MAALTLIPNAYIAKAIATVFRISAGAIIVLNYILQITIIMLILIWLLMYTPIEIREL
jgi:hypothetical protein